MPSPSHTTGGGQGPKVETDYVGHDSMNLAGIGLAAAGVVAIGGGILAGWYAGQAVTQLARLSVPSVRSAVLLLGVLVISSVVLSVLGFLVQRWCTIPDDER